jgi:hypothetical protein
MALMFDQNMMKLRNGVSMMNRRVLKLLDL